MAWSGSRGAGPPQPLATAAGSAVGGLALWLVPVLVATLAVGVLALRRRDPVGPPAARLPVAAVLRDRVAPAVTVFMGLQSLTFYAMLTWLADLLESDAGLSAGRAGGPAGRAAAPRGPPAPPP